MTFIFTDQPITTVDELFKQEKFWYNNDRIYHIGWVANWQAWRLHDLVKRGLFKVYQEVKV
jgi:hypothetical protein